AAHLPRSAATSPAGGAAGWPSATTPARLAPQLCLPLSAPLVSRRDRHPPSHRPALGLPGPRQGDRHLLVSHGRAGVVRAGRRAFRDSCHPSARRQRMTPTFDVLIQDFFCRRLIEQQGASPQTVVAYRDTFRLLLAYLPGRLRKPVTELALADLDA